MSDKSKHMARMARVAPGIEAAKRRMAAQEACQPRCPCGNPASIASYDAEDRVTLHCMACAPAEAAELMRRFQN